MREILLERILDRLAIIAQAVGNSDGSAEYTSVLNSIDTGISDLLTFLTSTQDSTLTQNITAGNSGTISAGYHSLTFFNDGVSNILVDGVSIAPGLCVSYTAKSLENTLPAKTYNAQTSSILIIGVQ